MDSIVIEWTWIIGLARAKILALFCLICMLLLTSDSSYWLFRYTYKLGHRLFNGTCIWSQEYWFRASPYPGQNSLQRVIIFGDMGKVWTLFHFFIFFLRIWKVWTLLEDWMCIWIKPISPFIMTRDFNTIWCMHVVAVVIKGTILLCM